MHIFTSLFLTLVVIFGVGAPREQMLSRQYQAGSWDGGKLGIVRTAEVKDGILYMDGLPSDCPADSSKDYWMPSLISTEKGTWFIDAFSSYKYDLVMRLDKRGENIRKIDFRHEIGKYPVKFVDVQLSDDQSMILVIFRLEDGGRVTYRFSVDPDLIPRAEAPSVTAAAEQMTDCMAS